MDPVCHERADDGCEQWPGVPTLTNIPPTGEQTNQDNFGYSVGYLSVIRSFPLRTRTNRQRYQLWFRLALWYCLFSRSKWNTVLTPLPTHSSHVCNSSSSSEYPCVNPYTGCVSESGDFATLFFRVRQYWCGCCYRHFAANFKAF